MADFSPVWSAFNEGELSPRLDGRVDRPQYMRGGKIALNYIPTVQGPLLRRGGTYLCGQTANSIHPSLLIRFSRSRTESYILEFYDTKVRFWFNGSLIMSAPNVPYTVTTPYTQADLFNADGTPAICAAESVDQVYLAHAKYPPQVLSYIAPNSWSLAPLAYVDGPWQDGNTNKSATVYITGGVTIGTTITITANAGIFQSGHVGSLFRLHQQDLSQIKPWEPGQKTPVIAVGVQRRSGYNTYQCVSASAGTPPSGGTTLSYVQTGGNTLTHTEGNAWDGDQTTTTDPIGAATYYSTGVEWSYQDCGYGVAVITGYTDSQHVTATVLRQFPAALLVSGNASYKWEMGAWNPANGYPSQVTFFNQRLVFAGGAWVWMSVSADFANFADLQFGQVTADSALTALVLSDQINNVTWLSPSTDLLVGTTGGEFVITQQSTSDPFGPTNFRIAPQSNFGGRSAGSIRVQLYTLFAQQSGLSLREFQYDVFRNAYQSIDVTVQSDHITNGGIVSMAFAKNPWYIIWCVLGNGNLVAFTYNPEQNVRCWWRADLGAGAKAYSVASVPSADGSVDDVYFVTKRTYIVNGFSQTLYQVEKLLQPFADNPGDSMQNAIYSDSALTLNNSINAQLTVGLGNNVQGATDIAFQTNTATFATTDVGRYIHYDWQSTQIGDDGLSYPVAEKGIAQITQYVSSTFVEATIIAPFSTSPLQFTVAANGWRMTVTTILAASIPTAWLGQTVSLLGDGACMPDVTNLASAADITLPFPCSIVQAGIKSPAVWQSMRPDVGGDQRGSAIGKKRKISKVTLRILDALGIKLGRDLADLDEIEIRPSTVPDDNPPPLVTGDTPRWNFNGEFDTSGRIMVACQQPLPATICAISANIEEVEDS